MSELDEISPESLAAAREWFANDALQQARAARAGVVQIDTNPGIFQAFRIERAERYLAGTLDHLEAVQQRARYIQFGTGPLKKPD